MKNVYIYVTPMVNSSLFLLLLNLTMHHEIGSSLFFFTIYYSVFDQNFGTLSHDGNGHDWAGRARVNLYYNKMWVVVVCM